MSAFSQFPQIPLLEVFQHLLVGATVVTPNRRLALALKASFDTLQIDQGRTAWQSPDILPLSAFIERIYQGALYSNQMVELHTLPVLLTAVQEQVLWESIIQSSDSGKALLTISQTAQWVREAWQLAHAWQLLPQLKNCSLNEDGKAFQVWAQDYQQITKQARQIDGARISDLLTTIYAQLDMQKPTALVCYGFDLLTPQQINFLNNLVSTGCEVMQCYPKSNNQSDHAVQRIACMNSQDEIYQAAAWARARIEADSSACIGIVVPELAKVRSTILRIFSAVMMPDVTRVLPSATQPVLPFNVSLGLALTAYPLIDTVFLILQLVDHKIEFSRVSRLLHSPFLVGSETEMSRRAHMDSQLRQYAEPLLTLDQLVVLIQHVGDKVSCPLLLQKLSELLVFRDQLTGTKSHSEFARYISEVLQIMGFPGERGLDSVEYQTLKKWQAVIANFAALDCVQPVCHYGEAIQRLHRMACETLFQPETNHAPIQILGVLEAAGMTFDHLWVIGLSDEVWPLRPRPNPFLPIMLQRQTKLPLGSTLESCAYSQQLTDGWLSSADEVVLSHPAYSDDRDGHALAPSPLIKQIAKGELALLTVPTYANHHDLIIQQSQLEFCIDDQVSPIEAAMLEKIGVRGGTTVIKDIAACPFRAWAKHRLNLESLNVPHIGLNAMERGSLIHYVLAQIWAQLKTKNALDTINAEDLEDRLKRAAKCAIRQLQQYRPMALPKKLVLLESRRLVHLAREWLNSEKQRSHFTVIATEEKRSFEIAGLMLNIRLDRIDELDDGQRVIIDYKTSKQSVDSMLGARPDEPQLPLYLIMTEPDASVVAFAQVKRGDMKFSAIVRDDGLLPGVKALTESPLGKRYDSWDELVATWKADLTSLASSFLSGNVQVNPKNFPKHIDSTCQYCELQSFCRIHERNSVSDFRQADDT